MTSFPPDLDLDKPLTARSIRVWGGLIFVICSAALGLNAHAHDTVAQAVASRPEHAHTAARVADVQAAARRALETASRNEAQLEAMRGQLWNVSAHLRVLTAATLEEARPPARRAMRRAATQAREAASQAGAGDPLAGLEGL